VINDTSSQLPAVEVVEFEILTELALPLYVSLAASGLSADATLAHRNHGTSCPRCQHCLARNENTGSQTSVLLAVGRSFPL